MGCWPRGRGISRIRGGTEEGGGEGEEGGRSFLTLELAVRQSTALSRSVSLRQQRQSSLHARSLCWTRRRGDGLVTISVPPSFGTVERDKPPCRTCLLSFLHLAGSDGDARLSMRYSSASFSLERTPPVVSSVRAEYLDDLRRQARPLYKVKRFVRRCFGVKEEKKERKVQSFKARTSRTSSCVVPLDVPADFGSQ